MSDASKTAIFGSASTDSSIFSRFFSVRYAAALVLVLLAGLMQSTRAQSLLILGDSLSAGYGIAQDEAWPSLLQDKLIRSGSEIKVINASISGDTTRGGLNRVSRLLKKHQPSLVMLELGANDGLRGIPASHAGQNLRAIIEKSKAAGARVLLFEMKIPPNYGLAFTEQYQAIYAELAQIEQVTLVPFFLADVIFKPGMMQSDGLHPTASAQPLLLEHVWPYISAANTYSGAQTSSDEGLEIEELSPY